MIQRQLLPEALSGDPGALQELLLRHQPGNLDGQACVAMAVALQHRGFGARLALQCAGSVCACGFRASRQCRQCRWMSHGMASAFLRLLRKPPNACCQARSAKYAKLQLI